MYFCIFPLIFSFSVSHIKKKIMINLASLPQNVMCHIFTFLDRKSILQMRKVSKSMKEIVDLCISSTRETEIKIFTAEPNEKGIFVRFYFKNSWDHCLWKSCFHYVMNKLEIPSFNLEDNAALYLLKGISATLNTEDFKRVFMHLKPFIRMTIFREIRLPRCTRMLARMCAEFLDGTMVHKMVLDVPKFGGHNDVYGELIQLVKPEFALLNIHVFTREAIDWLVQIDNVVNTLCITVRNIWAKELNAVSIVRELLSRKGKRLNIYFGEDNRLITLADTEALVQILHNSGRKACIQAWTNCRQMSVTIGVCSIKTEVRGDNYHIGRHIAIEHVGMR